MTRTSDKSKRVAINKRCKKYIRSLKRSGHTYQQIGLLISDAKRAAHEYSL